MSSLLTLFSLVIFSHGCSSFSIHDRGRFNISSDDVKTSIENGIKTDIGRVPWQVALRPRGHHNAFCGGSIIDKHWVLTAAHCIVHEKGGEWYILDEANNFIVTGASNLKSSPGLVEVPIERFIVHPKYSPGYLPNDIALVKTNMDLTKGNRFAKGQIIKLATNNDVQDYAKAIVSGYGMLSVKGPSTLNLYATNVRILPHEFCRKTFGSPYQSNKMICAGDVDHNFLSSTRPGDSGGPLVISNGIEKVLVGVTSFIATNDNGDKFPGGWTSVPYYLDWIRNTIRRNRFWPLI